MKDTSALSSSGVQSISERKCLALIINYLLTAGRRFNGLVK